LTIGQPRHLHIKKYAAKSACGRIVQRRGRVLMAHAADIGRQSSLDPDLLLEGVSRQGLLGL
jgi:hypothetical protein